MEDDDDESRIGSHQISPPPTPINRFLESVNIYKRNQIRVSIPRFILRGLGRNAYHVFEVKVCNAQFAFTLHLASKVITTSCLKMILGMSNY